MQADFGYLQVAAQSGNPDAVLDTYNVLASREFRGEFWEQHRKELQRRLPEYLAMAAQTLDTDQVFDHERPKIYMQMEAAVADGNRAEFLKLYGRLLAGLSEGQTGEEEKRRLADRLPDYLDRMNQVEEARRRLGES